MQEPCRTLSRHRSTTGRRTETWQKGPRLCKCHGTGSTSVPEVPGIGAGRSYLLVLALQASALLPNAFKTTAHPLAASDTLPPSPRAQCFSAQQVHATCMTTHPLQLQLPLA